MEKNPETLTESTPAENRRLERLTAATALLMLAAAVSAVLLLFRADPVRQAGESGLFDGQSAGIAVVNVNGAISFGQPDNPWGESVQGFIRTLYRLSRDERVKGLVVRVNSPGGTVAASQELYHALRRFRQSGKPVVVSMGDVAASGGYYISCAADRIYANPGTITGSIGVILQTPDLSGLYQWAHVRWNTVKSGRYKDIMSAMRQMQPEERRLLQTMVENAYNQFFSAVLDARPVKKAQLIQLAQGQIFSGQQAKAAGLVDETGDFEAALLKAGELAGIKGRPHLLQVRRRGGLGQFFQLFQRAALSLESLAGAAGILGGSAPAVAAGAPRMLYMYGGM